MLAQASVGNAQDNRARLPLPRITGFTNNGQPKSTGATIVILTPKKSTKKTGSPWPLLGVDTMEKEKNEEEEKAGPCTYGAAALYAIAPYKKKNGAVLARKLKSRPRLRDAGAATKSTIEQINAKDGCSPANVQCRIACRPQRKTLS